MGRRRCCCEECPCETTGEPGGTVEWFSHTVEDGVITRVDHEDPCITYWVDSTGGDPGGEGVWPETGTGTEDDPWINLYSVFNDDGIYCSCTTEGCPMVKVLVKGTIDYRVGSGLGDYLRRLVLEPWGEGRITIHPTDPNDVEYTAVYNIEGCVWKHTDATFDNPDCQFGAAGFESCYNSAFDDCTATGIRVGWGSGYGFSTCTHSAFSNCTGTGTSGDEDMGIHGMGYNQCTGSTFDTCTGTGTCTEGSDGIGFYYCDNSVFNSCDGTGTHDTTSVGSLEAHGYGFSDTEYCTFISCTGNGVATGPAATGAISRGFDLCHNSIYDDCDGTGTSNGSTYLQSYGFSNCDNSTFQSCDGVGVVNGTNYLLACGFYHNAPSSFDDCTTSAPVCVGYSPPCPITCDL